MTTSRLPLFDADRVRQAVTLLVEPGDVFELRALDATLRGQRLTRIVSGYFDSADALIAALPRIEAAKGIYFTLNPVLPDLLARRCNRLDYAASGETTGDQHIVRRRWLLIDVDPKRPAGISATDSEKEQAKSNAKAIREHLCGAGWPMPVVADSANGWHLLYRIEVPTDDGGLIAGALKPLAAKFDNAHCSVDQAVHNPARIIKLFGTLACKGDSTPDRPHRMSRIVIVPEPLEVVSREHLESLVQNHPVAAATKTTAAPSPKRNGQFDLAAFFTRHGIKINRTKQLADGRMAYLLAECPFDANHGGDGEVAVFQSPDGKLGFQCKHNTCSGRDWKAFRELFEGASPKRTPRPPGTGDFTDIKSAIIAILTDGLLKQAEKCDAVANIVVRALTERGRFYFHLQYRDFPTAMFFDSETKRLLRIQSDEFQAWLSDWTGVNRGSPFFKFITAAVETVALSGERTTGIIPDANWASRPNAIYVSNGDGQLVRIAPGKVELLDNGSDDVLFAAGQTLRPWNITEPRDPFVTCAMFREANYAAPHGRDLVKLFVLSIPSNPPSKPPLAFTGDIGSGKTAEAHGIHELLGLDFAPVKVRRNGEDDFWTGVNAGGIYTLDNADTKTDWLPDCVSTASTGGCSLKRKLYTDSENVTLRARAWIVITSAIPTFASDAGIADRMLVVRMALRTGNTEEAELYAEIAANRDAGLSWICHTLAAALADDVPVPKGLNRRHPDFAAFAVKIGRACGQEAEFTRALWAAESDKSRFCLENDTVGVALIAMLADHKSFVGTAAQMLPVLAAYDSDFSQNATGPRGNPIWSAKRLGKRLATLWPHVEAVADAKKGEDRNHFTVFNISPLSTADFADFETLKRQTPLREDDIGALPDSAKETPQTPRPSESGTQPELAPATTTEEKSHAETLEI
jgi:hypothetical protein